MDILLNESGGFLGDLDGNKLKYDNEKVSFNYTIIGIGNLKNKDLYLA